MMNIGTASNNTPAQGATRTESASRPAVDARSDDAARDKFADALRARSRDDGGQGERGEQDESQGEAPPNGLPAAFLPLPLHAAKAVEPAPRAGALPELSASSKVIEAALTAGVPMPVTAVGEADPAKLWEISVREPNAVAVDVKALRGEKLAHEANAAWSLSVSSPTVDADVLARHAPQLRERMKKHAVEFTHVRVEEKTQGDEQN